MGRIPKVDLYNHVMLNNWFFTHPCVIKILIYKISNIKLLNNISFKKNKKLIV